MSPFRLAAAALLAVIVLFVLIVLPSAPHRVRLSAPIDPLVRKGALHVHTSRSDGSGTVEQVAAAAAAAGLEFVVITDHGDGRGLEPPAYRSGVLCVDGSEISTNQGHVAAVGLKPAEYRLGGDARAVIEDVHRLGGIAVVAHPTSAKRELAWTAWDTPFDGIEWLNADSEWRDENALSLARAALGYWFRPHAAVARTFDRPAAALARADEAAARRPMLIVAGHDAHARIATEDREAGQGGLRLPSYRAMFRSFAVRVIVDAPPSGDAERDAGALVRALRRGRAFTALDGIASPARLAYTVRSGHATATIGDRIIPAGPLEFEVAADAPGGAEILLMHDGRQVASGPAPALRASLAPSPGAYRVEVRVRDAPGSPPVPWIVSGPVYVGLSDGLPSRPRSADAVLMHLSRSDDAAAWTLEHSPDSAGSVSVAADTPAVQFSYQLGHESASPYAALARPVAIPAHASALAFRLRSDRPMRLSVQLRSSDGGGDGRRWRRSVYADATEQLVRLDLVSFKPVPPHATALERDHVDSLLLVVDTVNSDRAASGVISIADLRLVGTDVPQRGSAGRF